MPKKKLHFNRLIRDGIIDKMNSKKLEYKVEKLSQKDFIKELKAKIPEEAEGVVNAKNKKELIKELADLVFVIEEVKKRMKISPLAFNKAMKDNIEKKGGFKKKMYLYWTNDDGYRTNEKRESKK